jgi:hypothetical protein
MGKAHLAGVTHPTHVANYRAVVAEVALAGPLRGSLAEATAAAAASPRLAHAASCLGARAAAWMGDGEHVREALDRMVAADGAADGSTRAGGPSGRPRVARR